jgi:hypothetical protein
MEIELAGSGEVLVKTAMPTLQAAIGLVAAPGTNLSTLHSAEWYRTYFLDPTTGIAGYWFNQTGGDFVLKGRVFEWTHFPEDPDYDDRDAIIDAGRAVLRAGYQALSASQRSSEPDPDTFPQFIFVVARPGANINAGSTGDGGNAVFHVGQEFDFHAHELGHMFGLDHSFDVSNTIWSPDSNRPGEYGHQYCIMSAQTYGNASLNGAAPPFLQQVPEYRNYGPRYSAASQAARGYIDVIDVALPPANDTQTVILTSAGSPGALQPKAARLHGMDGNTYIISYRNPADPFDARLKHPAVVIETVESGHAEQNYPGLHAATFVADIKLPIVYGANDSTFQGPGFAVSILDWEKDNDGPIWIGISQIAPMQLTLEQRQNIEILNEIFDNGTVHFHAGQEIDGKEICAGGTYDWTLWRHEFGIPLEVNVDSIGGLTTTRWFIEGSDIGLPTNTVSALNFSRPTIGYPPLPFGMKSRSTIEVQYEHPTLERLVIYNRSADGVFDLKVSCSVTTRAGTGTITDRVSIIGQVLSIPRFARDEENCRRFRRQKKFPKPRRKHVKRF